MQNSVFKECPQEGASSPPGILFFGEEIRDDSPVGRAKKTFCIRVYLHGVEEQGDHGRSHGQRHQALHIKQFQQLFHTFPSLQKIVVFQSRPIHVFDMPNGDSSLIIRKIGVRGAVAIVFRDILQDFVKMLLTVPFAL